MIALRVVRGTLPHRSLLVKRTPSILHRSFAISSARKSEPPSASISKQTPPNPGQQPVDHSIFYVGPLSGTFRSLKVFSLSSLSLCVSVAPFLYMMDASLATSARTGIIAFAIATSSFSTGMVSWFAGPYVQIMRRLSDMPASATTPTRELAPGAVELVTRTVLLQERRTRVYDPIFLGPTKRPFAKWELAMKVVVDTSRDDVLPNPDRKVGGVEVAAETLDSKGNVKGKWLIRWQKQPGATSDNLLVGIAATEGKVVRHFQVHEELL